MGFLSKAFTSVGGLLNKVTGVSDTAKQSYKNSVNMAALQQANNIELWNLQNQYNSPTAQLARMSAAGIDINPMTYAVGNGNMSSTAQNISPASYHAPSYGSPGNPLEMAMSIAQGIQGLKNAKAQEDLTRTQIENWEHDHASPYKDFINALASIFSDRSDRSTKGFIPEWLELNGRPVKGYKDKNGKIDLRA